MGRGVRRPAGFGRRTCVRPDGGLPLRLREAPQVFLKSITLHGFKSFAGRTTLELPKGIAAVVGPNGSGKSNIDRKSTRLNSSHVKISYAVFCSIKTKHG